MYRKDAVEYLYICYLSHFKCDVYVFEIEPRPSHMGKLFININIIYWVNLFELENGLGVVLMRMRFCRK